MRFLDQPTPACTGTGCSAFDSERRDTFSPKSRMRDLPHAVDDDGRFEFVAGAQQRAGESFLRSCCCTTWVKDLADGISQGKCWPGPIPHIAAVGHRASGCSSCTTGEPPTCFKRSRLHASRGSEANAVIRTLQRPDPEPAAGFAEFPALALTISGALACGSVNSSACQPTSSETLKRRVWHLDVYAISPSHFSRLKSLDYVLNHSAMRDRFST